MLTQVDFVFSVQLICQRMRFVRSRKHYAKTETPVVSNNSAHRWTPDVPMVVPEVNPEHFEVIEYQKKRLGTTERIYRSKTKLFNPELCAVHLQHGKNLGQRTGCCNYIPGNFRCRKDLQRLAGNGRKHHSIHWWRRRKERAGTASCSRARVENGQIVKGRVSE